MQKTLLSFKMPLSFKLAAGLVVVFAFEICSAQSPKNDSLLKLLNSHPWADTVRAALLTKIALDYAATDRAAGLEYADTAIRLAQQLNQPRQLADAYLAEAKNYEYKADLKGALSPSFSALKLYQKLASNSGIAQCYVRIAYDYYGVADYTASLDYATRAVNTARLTGNKRLIGQCLTALGSSYNLLADYPNAISCYLGQLHLAGELRDTSAIARAMGNIGVVYFYLKKYPEALNYYTQCLELLMKLHDEVAVAVALNNIGAVYIEKGDYLKVIDYNQKALTINRRSGMIKGEANDLMDLSLAYTHLSRYDDSFNSLTRAIAIYDKIGAKNNSSIALGQMASIYMDAPVPWLLKQGVSPAMRYRKAAELQKKAVQLANETKNLNNESDQWKKLSMVYERQKNYEDALKSYRNYAVLKDSVFNDKKQQEITRLTLRYDYDKKEAALRSKNAQIQAAAATEIARQKVIKNAAVIIGLVLVISGCTTFIFYRRRKNAREKLREAEFKAQVAETELKALRSQLNPHFIFNSLNSISDYIARHDKVTADTYLVKFAKLMRRILENSEQKTVSLADDLKTLELYMQLESLRLDNKFLYEIRIEDGIDTETTMVPPMLLQPFVENSIWHGISPKEGYGKILIRVKRQGDMIEYVLEDNGIGRQRSAALKIGKNAAGRRSFGIKVIQSRINIINESRQARSKVELTDLAEGTRVSIKVPYESSF